MDKFASKQLAKMSRNIDAGLTTSVIGIPCAGISLFIKALSEQPLGFMAYINLFSLLSIDNRQFYETIATKLGQITDSKNSDAEIMKACIVKLEQLLKIHPRVVICIAGFDQLKLAPSSGILQCLRSLRAVDQSKVVFVFGICRRLDTVLPASLTDTDLSLFSSIYYLRPYTDQDLRYLLSEYGPHLDTNADTIDQLIDLSGGHFQFLQLLLSSDRAKDPTQDPFILLAFRNIYSHLSTSQKNIVRKLAAGNIPRETDNFLYDIGIAQELGSGRELFSPLFSELVRIYAAPKLPLKERRLLSALRNGKGRVVPKRDIYDAVWLGDEIGSEWALNALVYRLRKHPAFVYQNMIIENHKKLGYSLSKNDDRSEIGLR